jgi:hypothetical protein
MSEELEVVKTIVDIIGGPGLAIFLVIWGARFLTGSVWPAAIAASGRLGELIDRAVLAAEKLALRAEELVEVQRGRSEQ